MDANGFMSDLPLYARIVQWLDMDMWLIYKFIRIILSNQRILGPFGPGVNFKTNPRHNKQEHS